MIYPLKTISLLTASALLAFNPLAAVETDPVGYVTTTAQNGSDTFAAAVLSEQIELATSVDSVSTSVVTTTLDLSPDAFNNTHYVLFTSGEETGQWYEVIDTAASSLTLEIDVAALGVTAGDSFKVVKFWTLESLFPSSSEFAASNDPTLPVAEVLLNDLNASGTNLSSAASYFYHDGSSPILNSTAGWYQTGSLSPSGDVRLSPETYFTVRNLSGEDFNITVPGSVPTSPVGTTVVSSSGSQDNQLVNPYPAAMSLNDSGLTSVVSASTDPTLPGDQIILFNIVGSSTNRSSVASYFYHDGSSPILNFTEGWYQVGSLTPAGSVEIPAGGAFWIRKSPAASPSVAEWTPALPYTL